ncbi:transmembrane protein 53-like [Iris pallida]|uniref:Transmembrane protein 53-like n=1 Tax=Iris pallida TaxID=29817 RepID=A0AAX6DU65_IRIPA|nr:transmembrane protein 53-like [Iris pallida]
MAYFPGNLHRPLSAMAAVAVATVSTDLPNQFHPHKPTEPNAVPKSGPPPQSEMWVSRISITNYFAVNVNDAANCPFLKPAFPRMPVSPFSGISPSVASPPALLGLYQYAKLANPSKDQDYKLPAAISPPSDVMYRWHLPDPNAGSGKCSLAKSRTLVVLLGWLGAKQRHLKRYAEWYTSRGFHVVTFTFPMADVISYKVGGKAEENLDLLANHLAEWVTEESGKKLVFHTFSNTGWLTYGVLLEKFQNQGPSVMGRIKGCIVDSAPVAAPDPQVWASGFSAAFLKKQSVAAKGMRTSENPGMEVFVSTNVHSKPAVAEAALLVVLEKFFEVVLNLPSINRRLHDVLDLLSSKQPKCPQLYVYSSADRVIPVKSVESFIERQRRAGHDVRACDFLNSPHVDHFRNHPILYSSQLTNFLEDCVLPCCKDS